MAGERLVVALTEVGEADASAGGKALGLARMARAGLPVPAGFCILAVAYREQAASPALAARVRAAAEAPAGASHEARRRLLADLRREIAEAALSPELGAEIAAHLGQLGGQTAGRAVAVRSSATSEDLAGHSFAGQHESFLGVRGIESCLRAVAACWASLWTERAAEYRERNGFGHLGAAMAVVVQEFVPADAAGVAFTADPVTGRADRVVIEGCFGLGDALVSGRLAPDRFVFARRRLRPVARSIGSKAIERVVGEDGEVHERPVPAERAARACLDERAARRIAELALAAERVAGSPQDVEWAVRGGEAFLLQSRPVTALGRERSFEDRQIWTNANTGEVLPDVVSPMTWSLVKPVIDEIFGEMFGKIGIRLGEHPITGLVAGRVYFNFNTMAGIFRCFPGLRGTSSDEMFGGAQDRLLAARRIEVAEGDIPDLRPRLARMAWKLPGFLLWFMAHSPTRGLPAVDRVRRASEKLAAVDLRALSDEELFSHLDVFGRDAPDIGAAIAFATVGVSYLSSLFTICRRWLGDSDGTLARRLLAGMGGMDSAEAGLALWRLAARAHESPEVGAALVAAQGSHEGCPYNRAAARSEFEAIRSQIARAKGGDAFLAQWDEFMARHGHHARGEVDIMIPRWSERPDAVLDMVRGYLRGFGQADPVAVHRQRGIEREGLTEQCQRRLRNPLKRLVFRFILRRAQLGCVVRENLKSEAVRRLAVARRMLLELGDRLARRGVLAQAGDIFFLRAEEVQSVARGEAGIDVRRAIAERRAEYERNRALAPPAVVVGRFDPARFVPDEACEGAEILTGIAVSAGVARGPARVILRAEAAERVLPGEILVAPFTDPGWTPYFLPAAGIVVDMGGQLSHGSIVAREYGIPAVVNVGPATRLIRTGQQVEVDGNRGIVRILP